jgi:hypothetical protein
MGTPMRSPHGTNRYPKLSENLELHRTWAERVGTGLDLSVTAEILALRSSKKPRKAKPVADIAVQPAEPTYVASSVGLFSDLFSAPKSKPMVIIRNVLGEQLDVVNARDLWGQNLRGRQWQPAELSGLSLQGANCEGINLLGARLVRTSFYGANLKSAEISFADTSGADF